MVCGPVVAEVCEEVKTEPAKAEEPIKEAVAEEEEEEETTEFASFAGPAPYSGGDLALDWGTASIGAGTLYPQQPYAVQSGGFFPWGRGVGGQSSGDVIYPGSPTTIINNIINNYNRPPDPIPEPASILAWSIGLLVIGLLGLRRQKLKQKLAGSATTE
jgi:hypothetical protein